LRYQQMFEWYLFRVAGIFAAAEEDEQELQLTHQVRLLLGEILLGLETVRAGVCVDSEIADVTQAIAAIDETISGL